MTTARPAGFEFKHIEVPQNSTVVDLVTNRYGTFFWEVMATQTVVAKESHLESGKFNEDNLYSVTTTERFVAIDLKRPNDLPNLSKIKDIERQYFQMSAELSNLGASTLDDYASPPPMTINWMMLLGLAMFSAFIGGVLYYLYKDKKHKETVAQWSSLKPKLDALIQDNRGILNISS